MATARSNHPWTSHAAGQAASQFKADHHQQIINALKGIEGTIYDIADNSDLPVNSVARRMNELEKMNIAELTGTYGLSPSGRHCRVWRLNPNYTHISP